MKFENLCEKHKELVIDKIIELNDVFMEELRKIDVLISKETGEVKSTSSTIAFNSLSMLAGHLIARYTKTLGSQNQAAILLKDFNRKTESFCDQALKEYTIRMRDENASDNQTFQ